MHTAQVPAQLDGVVEGQRGLANAGMVGHLGPGHGHGRAEQIQRGNWERKKVMW